MGWRAHEAQEAFWLSLIQFYGQGPLTCHPVLCRRAQDVCVYMYYAEFITRSILKLC
jgi:hypothetical protein